MTGFEIPLIMMAVGGATSAYTAMESNKAAEKVADEQAAQAFAQKERQQQVAAMQQEAEAKKAIREGRLAEGQARAAGEAGADRGSYGQYVRQTKRFFGSDPLKQTFARQQDAIRSSETGYRMNIGNINAQLAQNTQNVALGAFTGALSGFSTGLSMQSSINSLSGPAQAATTPNNIQQFQGAAAGHFEGMGQGAALQNNMLNMLYPGY